MCKTLLSTGEPFQKIFLWARIKNLQVRRGVLDRRKQRQQLFAYLHICTNLSWPSASSLQSIGGSPRLYQIVIDGPGIQFNRGGSHSLLHLNLGSS